MRVAIIGRTRILYETALRLHEAGHEIGCIVTARAVPEYRCDENDFRQLAEKLNVSFLFTNTLENPGVEELCRGLDIGVSVNWVSVVRQKHISLFSLGILNSHHGDLPKYRGNACSNWAIINNEEQVTNTIHFMEGGKLDCGKIICQEHFRLNEDTTITEVYKWAEESTPLLFVQALKMLGRDNEFIMKFADPDSPESFRCYPRLPEDSFINWGLSALQIHNLIRAVCYPFSGAYTYHWNNGKVRRLIILKSRIVTSETNDLGIPGHVLENNRDTGESLVLCGHGIIALSRCRYDDEEEEFSPGQRWRSIRMRLGVRAEDWLWEIEKDLLSKTREDLGLPGGLP